MRIPAISSSLAHKKTGASAYTTGIRISALDSIKKPATSMGTSAKPYGAGVFSPSSTSRTNGKLVLVDPLRTNHPVTPKHTIGPLGLSNDLKNKVIDASATTAGFTAPPGSQGAKRKNSILLYGGNVTGKGKTSGGHRVSNPRMSPLNKFLKDAMPSSKVKRNSAKKAQKTMSINKSRGDNLQGDFIVRANNTLSTE